MEKFLPLNISRKVHLLKKKQNKLNFRLLNFSFKKKKPRENSSKFIMEINIRIGVSLLKFILCPCMCAQKYTHANTCTGIIFTSFLNYLIDQDRDKEKYWCIILTLFKSATEMLTDTDRSIKFSKEFERLSRIDYTAHLHVSDTIVNMLRSIISFHLCMSQLLFSFYRLENRNSEWTRFLKVMNVCY